MIETLIFLLNVYKYANTQQTETRNQGQVVVSPRPTSLPEETFQVAQASFYDRSACGSRIYRETCKTANGDVFNEDSFTMACSNDIPLGSHFQLCYLDKCIEAVCTDRGNFAKYGRTFDFSLGLFKWFADPSVGVIKVKYVKL